MFLLGGDIFGFYLINLCLFNGKNDTLCLVGSFIGCMFMFRSMTYFKSIVVYGVRYRALFMEKTILSPLNYLSIFVENLLIIYVWVSFCTPLSCSIDLFYFMSTPSDFIIGL